jgi:hypothetical protein
MSFNKVMAQKLDSIMDLNANTVGQTNNKDKISEKDNSYHKHEIGFSIGAFPTIGCYVPPDKGVFPFEGPFFNHTYHIIKGEMYEKMYHFGSYTFNYNYHFNSKHSIGASLSWVGKHIEKYWIYGGNGFFGGNTLRDTVNGSGWNHYFTLQFNYRYIYYSKNDIIFLYFGIYQGILLCIRDKEILPKETVHVFGGTISNNKYYFSYALQLNAFGMELGKRYVYHIELGIGTQGIIKTGFRYKF